MYGCKEVYKLNKNLSIYKCKDLMNNAKFACVVNIVENTIKIFTTLKRSEAKKELDKFLDKLKKEKQRIREGNYFIILDNI